MRDYTNAKALPANAIYKEVVVIGNGPSGLALSFHLAGNMPYFNGNTHPDEMLTTRLRNIPSGRSLIQQDLQYLSQGLEGRTNNPVSLLMDALCHPSADQGIDLPSLVDWRRETEREVDHIVLGKGLPGGAWQAMDPNVLTISLNSWMELPGLTWSQWETRHNVPATGPSGARRVPVATVAAYYSDYVRFNKLGRYFRSNITVTAVRQIGKSLDGACNDARWIVEGYDALTNEQLMYACNKVVMATGSTDVPNRLAIPGELTNPDFVFHDLVGFENALQSLARDNQDIRDGVRLVEPVAIVGAGLSASDAVLSARFWSMPVLHAFRRVPLSPDRMLPENMYPEYHKVRQMMGDKGRGYPDYSAFPEHKLLDISSMNGKKIHMVSPGGEVSAHKVSLVAVLIGSRPDLSYLPPEFQDGIGLGVKPNEPIDCRSNPMSVNPWSHCLREGPPGMYAVGPLSGDNFVRFLLGGVVAVVHDIQRHRKLQKCCCAR